MCLHLHLLLLQQTKSLQLRFGPPVHRKAALL
jgi:hypothetical protein